ncbi:MAG: hypothetical protein ACE5PO_01165 [Candidatus Bathyarchaeia archaeon]
MRRKFLAARDDLVDKVSEIARSKNVTLFGMINDTLEQLVKAEELGDNLSTILEEHITIKMAKDAGFTVVPDSLWNYLLERTFDKDKVTLGEIWRSTGEWFGRFCQVRAATDNSVYAVEKIMDALLWNVSEVSVQPTEDGLIVKCVGSRLQYAQTALLSDFIVGMVSSFDYQLRRKNVARGIISLEFIKEGERPA